MTPKKDRQKIIYGVTKGSWGGAQRYVYDLATSLPRDHFETVVICGQGQILPERLSKAGIPTIELKHLGRDIRIFSELLTFFSLLKIFYRERPDIIHLNSPKMAGLGALAGRLTGVPKIIFTAHGWSWHEERPRWQKALIWFGSWLSLLLAHQVIVISKSELAGTPNWLNTRHKTTLIYNGIAPTDFLYRDTARAMLGKIEPKLEVNRARLWLGTISELHRNKGIDLLLSSLAALKIAYPNFIFVVIGEGEERESLTYLIKKNDLTEQVFLLGAIPEASRYLKAFDVFTLSSRKEGLPYTILEAGQAALPVVASKICGIPEIIKNDQAGVLINPHETEKVTKKLAGLAGNNLEREILGLALEEIVRKNFSLENMVNQTLNLYNR